MEGYIWEQWNYKADWVTTCGKAGGVDFGVSGSGDRLTNDDTSIWCILWFVYPLNGPAIIHECHAFRPLPDLNSVKKTSDCRLPAK
jgi:hypothetical protein